MPGRTIVAADAGGRCGTRVASEQQPLSVDVHPGVVMAQPGVDFPSVHRPCLGAAGRSGLPHRPDAHDDVGRITTVSTTPSLRTSASMSALRLNPPPGDGQHEIVVVERRWPGRRHGTRWLRSIADPARRSDLPLPMPAASGRRGRRGDQQGNERERRMFSALAVSRAGGREEVPARRFPRRRTRRRGDSVAWRKRRAPTTRASTAVLLRCDRRRVCRSRLTFSGTRPAWQRKA